MSGDVWLGGEGADRVFVAGGWRGSHAWLPVPPGPDTQRVTSVFNVQAPLEGRAVANGVLTRIDTLPYGHTTWHYRLDSLAPIRSLAVAAGHFAVVRLSPRVEVWTLPADSARVMAGPFGRAAEMLDRFTAALGPLAYPGIVHVVAPGVPMVVAGGGLVLYPADRARDGGITESDVARATARQWLDGADSTLADELSAWLAAEWLEGRPPREPRRVSEARARLGEAAFRRGLQAFARAQREGRGSAEAFAAAMQQHP